MLVSQPKISDQCDINVGLVIEASIPRVVPPRINSRSRECPYPPMTMRSGNVSAAYERIAFETSILLTGMRSIVTFTFRAQNVRNNNTRLAGASKKRHGIGDRSRGCAAAIPAHHDMIEFEAVFLNKRNDEDRSSGFEQRRLNDDILGRMIPAAFKLANDGKIESSCDMRKLRWYVANASFNPARYG